jgi:prepilin-type N-terminal cleavage/methylation domain-containing protein
MIKIGARKGFSLIEIGIVMVVIGLIIAAVMKGKDVIRGAENKEVTKTFMDKWVNVADTFYDKTGYNLTADGNTSLMMTVADGYVDTNCTNVIDEAAERGGVDVRKIVKAGGNDNICTRLVTGEFTSEALIGVGFASAYVKTDDDRYVDNADVVARNLVVFGNVPADIVHAFEKLYDTKVDGRRGKVVALDEYTSVQPNDRILKTTNGKSMIDVSTTLANGGQAFTATTTDTGVTTNSATTLELDNPIQTIPVDSADSLKLYTIAVILEH